MWKSIEAPKIGDRTTFSWLGENKSGDTIRRKRGDNKLPPFWGVNERTGKRGKAVKLAVFECKSFNRGEGR